MKPDETNRCPECGAEMPTGSPEALCSACLLRQALASRTIAGEDAAAASPPPSPEEIADKFPQFEILRCLGRGGMGVVYQARQKSLNREVAIKVLAPERVGDPKFAERFSREAELLARLNHPHIVTIHDFGETGGLYYLVMEYVDGVNLRDLLREGKMEPEQALAIVPPVCEALEFAHGKGVVHRDIKPENLLLDRDGRVKIADFGIASLVGATGEHSGTPPYMAPEQESGRVDRRADIYALGVVLYEMLTGERPTTNVVEPSKKVQVDVKIDEMVLRALEKEPERRYQTAGEFRTVVETIRPPVPAGVAEEDSARPRGMFRRFWWVMLVLVLLGPLLGFAAGLGWSYVVPKRYEAQATVGVTTTPGAMTEEAFHLKIVEGIRSRGTLERVADELDLARSWAMDPREVVLRLGQMVSTETVRGTDLYRIHVRHSDAKEAARIADQVTRAFIDTSKPAGLKVIVHEQASPPTRPVSPNVVLNVGLAAAGGLLVSPLIALTLMALLHRLFPVRGVRRPVPSSGSASRWALGLLVAALLGTALLSAVAPGGRHGWVLAFGVLCALGSFGCAVASWSSKLGKGVAIAWIALVVGCLVLLPTVYVHSRVREGEAKRAAEALRADAEREMAKAVEQGGELSNDSKLADERERAELARRLVGVWRQELAGGVKAEMRIDGDGSWSASVAVFRRDFENGGSWWLDSAGFHMRKEFSSNPEEVGGEETFEVTEISSKHLVLTRTDDEGESKQTRFRRVSGGSPTADVSKQTTADDFIGRWRWKEGGDNVDEVWLIVRDDDEAMATGSDHNGELSFRTLVEWKLDDEAFAFRQDGEEVRGLLSGDGTELRFERKGKLGPVFRKTTEFPGSIDTNLIGIQDFAIEMLAAIREKDDESLKSLATDRIEGWREALPAFAGELRERYRRLMGNGDFQLWPTEVLVKGDFGLARCTGPEKLEGKCVVLSFAMTEQGWKNCLLRISTEDVPLRSHLKELEEKYGKPARDESLNEDADGDSPAAERIAADEEVRDAGVVVRLSDDPSLDPGGFPEIATRPIIIRQRNGKRVAVVKLHDRSVRDRPFSVSAVLKLAGNEFPVGSYSYDGDGHRDWKGNSSSTVSNLIVEVGALDPAVREAELVLSPDPGFVRKDSRVKEIWSKDVVLRGIPLKRLDVSAEERAALSRDFEEMSNQEIIRVAMERPDEDRPWILLKERVENGRFGATDADDLMGRLTGWLRRNHPNGHPGPPGFLGQLLQAMHRRNLLLERTIMDYLEALHGNGTKHSSWFIDDGEAAIVRCDTRSPFHDWVDHWLGYALLREVGAITLDGKPVEVRRVSKRLLNGPGDTFELKTAGLEPGKHTVGYQVFSALVPAADVAGLSEWAPRSEWPEIKQSWTADSEVELVVEP